MEDIALVTANTAATRDDKSASKHRDKYYKTVTNYTMTTYHSLTIYLFFVTKKIT